MKKEIQLWSPFKPYNLFNVTPVHVPRGQFIIRFDKSATPP